MNIAAAKKGLLFRTPLGTIFRVTSIGTWAEMPEVRAVAVDDRKFRIRVTEFFYSSCAPVELN